MTYHHIAPLPAGNSRAYFVSPTIFEQQLAYLKQKNYKTLTAQEFYDQLRTSQNPAQKSVLLTFDDGNADNYTNAYPLLLKYGYVGTFFIPTSKSGINKTKLKEMADHGMSIESHSKTHIDLVKETNPDILYDEVVNSKYALQNMTGHTVIAFSYPGCVYNSSTIALDNQAGYKIAFSCAKSIDHKPGGRLAISRMHVYNDMEDFKKRLSGIWEIPVNYPD
jgi:peptidoglycan/xylan/chitin deacetylase (PgdA/CDA1 family)